MQHMDRLAFSLDQWNPVEESTKAGMKPWKTRDQ